MRPGLSARGRRWALLFALGQSVGCHRAEDGDSRPSAAGDTIEAAILDRILAGELEPERLDGLGQRLLHFGSTPLHTSLGREEPVQEKGPSAAATLGPLEDAAFRLLDSGAPAILSRPADFLSASRAQQRFLERLLGAAVMARFEVRARLDEQGLILAGARIARSNQLASLDAWLTSPRPELRAASAAAIVHATMRSVVAFTQEQKQALRTEQADALRALLPSLAACADDPEARVHGRAALALFLAHRGVGASPPAAPTSTPPALRQCLDDDDPFLRQSAALWLLTNEATAGSAVTTLVSTFDSGRLSRRCVGAVLLAHESAAVPACRAHLEDPDERQAEKAAIVLAMLADWNVTAAAEALKAARPAPAHAATQAMAEMGAWRDVDVGIRAAIEAQLTSVLEELGLKWSPRPAPI